MGYSVGSIRKQFTSAAILLLQIRVADKTLGLSTFEMPDGKIEQYQIATQTCNALGRFLEPKDFDGGSIGNSRSAMTYGLSSESQFGHRPSHMRM